jgi:hypothetical protein
LLKSIGTAAGIQLQREAMRTIGVDIPPSAIRMTSERLPDQHVVELRVEWYPKPDDGCIITGGPLDGATVKIPKPEAPLDLELPTLQIPDTLDEELDSTPAELTVARYHRHGIETDTHQWVYRYQE